MIQTSSLCVRFNDRAAIRYADLTFEDGQSYVLLGASGCGKSTLLNMIAGVLTPTEGTVTVGGEKVALTLKEYDLLHFLMENRGTAFSREQLLNRIWDYSYEGGSRTVDVHIQTLRAKLGRCGEMIETVRGVGYRFGGK